MEHYITLVNLVSSLNNGHLAILLKYYLMNDDYKAMLCATSGASLMISPTNPDWQTLDSIYKLAFKLNMISIEG